MRPTNRAYSILVILLAAICIAPVSADPAPKPRNQIILNSSLTILVDPAEPAPIAAAAQDLAGDFEKVFGSKPKIISRPEDAAPVTILIAYRSALAKTMQRSAPTEPESFSLTSTTARWKNGNPTTILLLTGADVRGAIYAVYQFSEEYLGVDPMYYWTDRGPARRDQIAIDTPLQKKFPAPLFHYRGFFINDEDLLTGWAPGEKKDGTGISLEVWNKIYETILRLKGNMVAPGTWIFPDEPQVKLAGRRGLIITQHHAIPLGMNVARWPENVPYSYSAHPEILERAWKNAAAEYAPDQEVLWTVGLRGLTDASYAAFDPAVRGNDKALGELVTKAIADQVSIVRSLHPGAKFITSLWQEGARLVQQGYLKIPPEVGTVWADTGYGYLQDKGQVTKGQGAYYHVAMMNYRANQLTEMVPMERVAAELGRYIKAGATNYLLINTSDIRPVAMMTKAVMDVGWKGVSPDTNEEFYERWSADEFGEKAAPSVAEIYREYFAAPAHIPGTDPPLEYGDQYYHTEARRLLLDYMVGSPLFYLGGQSPKWQPPRVITNEGARSSSAPLSESIQGELTRCGDAQPRWDTLWKKAVDAEALIPEDRRPFYHAHVLATIAINRESNRILFLSAKALQAAIAGNTAEARTVAEQALAAVSEIKKVEAAAEYGKWQNWYRGDWLTGVDRTAELLQNFLHYLDDPLAHMPAPIIWSGWEAYYHIMHYEGDRVADVN